MRKLLVALAVWVVSASAQATIVDHGVYFQDTGTGLYWLKLTESRGQSYDSVSSKFGELEEFEGWRYATAAEVDAFIAAYGIAPQGNSCVYGNYCETVAAIHAETLEDLIRLFGDSWDQYLDGLPNSLADVAPAGAGKAVGIVAQLPSGEFRALTFHDKEIVYRATGNFYLDGPDTISYNNEGVFSSSQAWGWRGSFLVRTTNPALPIGGAGNFVVDGHDVVDTGTGLEWRRFQYLIEDGYNTTLPFYGEDSGYRYPSPAEFDNLFAKSFPGFVTNDAEGRCSETDNAGNGGYPGQTQQARDFMDKFYSPASASTHYHALYEDAGGTLRALDVLKYSSGAYSRICKTGIRADYEYERFDKYPSNVPTMVVRNSSYLEGDEFTIFNGLLPEDLGLSGRCEGGPYGGWSGCDYDLNGWNTVPLQDYSGSWIWEDFYLSAGPAAATQAKPWMRIISLEYSGVCAAGDTDLGGTCLQVNGDPAFYLLPAVGYSSIPGSASNATGPFYSVDNVEVEFISENVVIDFDPWSAANEIRPKDVYYFGLQINTTSVADGDAYDFDASTVDPASLAVGPNLAPNVSQSVLTADYDNDGDLDYIFAFRVEASGLTCFDEQITLTGRTYSGDPIVGHDVIVPINCEETATIDVDPWNVANEVRPNDNYTVPVAIMTTSIAQGDAGDVDATTIDPATVKFGPNQTAHTGSIITVDLDSDSDADVVFGFNAFDSGIACGDTELSVVGTLANGLPLVGSDAITTTDCDTGCHP